MPKSNSPPSESELAELISLLKTNAAALHLDIHTDQAIVELFEQIQLLNAPNFRILLTSRIRNNRNKKEVALLRAKCAVMWHIIELGLCYVDADKIMRLLFQPGEAAKLQRLAVCNLLAYAIHVDIDSLTLPYQAQRPLCFRNIALIKFLIEDQFDLALGLRFVYEYFSGEVLGGYRTSIPDYMGLFLPAVNADLVQQKLQELPIIHGVSSRRMHCAVSGKIPVFPVKYKREIYDLVNLLTNLQRQDDDGRINISVGEVEFDLLYLHRMRALLNRPKHGAFVVDAAMTFCTYNRAAILLLLGCELICRLLPKPRSAGTDQEKIHAVLTALFCLFYGTGLSFTAGVSFRSSDRLMVSNYFLRNLVWFNLSAGCIYLLYSSAAIQIDMQENIDKNAVPRALQDFVDSFNLYDPLWPHGVYLASFCAYIALACYKTQPNECKVDQLGKLSPISVEKTALSLKYLHVQNDMQQATVRTMTLCFNRLVMEGKVKNEFDAQTIARKVASYVGPSWR
jgi:hypothetical protein